MQALLESSSPLRSACRGARPGARSRTMRSAQLPLNARRELDHSRLVRLRAQILKTGCAIWVHVVRMIEEVEKVRGETQFQPLCQAEVLEQGDIRVPGARSQEEGARVRVDSVGNRRKANSSVGQR